MRYAKTPYTVDEHIELLELRGLIIGDRERAKRYLSNIGYFRLTGYMYHLQTRDGSRHFFEGITFNNIILHYQFDKKLRALIMDGLETIEVALRAKLTDNFSLNHGFYWYTHSELYGDQVVYNLINDKIKQYFADPQEKFHKSFNPT